MVSAAAGVLAALDLRHRCVAVDHLTIGSIDPADWDQVFLLAVETTFKIRPAMEHIGDKLVVICSSREPGLDRWLNFFFPHMLFSIRHSGDSDTAPLNHYLYDALMGREKDSRTVLLQHLETAELLDKGLIGYAPGNYYGPKNKLNASKYYNGLWEYETSEIKNLYDNELNYLLSRDSTTRLPDGHFSSGVIPSHIYKRSKFSIAAETDNVGNHVFVTEKTWKPMMFRKDILFYATAGHEDFLESLGFEIPLKTGGDPAKIVEHLTNMEKKWDAKWLDAQHHNHQLCNPQRWISVFYSWLDRNVRT